MHIQIPTGVGLQKIKFWIRNFFPALFCLGDFFCQVSNPQSESIFFLFPEKRMEKYPLKASAKVLLDVFNLFWEFPGKKINKCKTTKSSASIAATMIWKSVEISPSGI